MLVAEGEAPRVRYRAGSPTVTGQVVVGGVPGVVADQAGEGVDHVALTPFGGSSEFRWEEESAGGQEHA